MRKNTTIPLNQPSISWHPVAPALCLALVLAGRPKHSPQALPRSSGAMAHGSWRPR
jgi:hypothetical protein